jgi:hypothetical protein
MMADETSLPCSKVKYLLYTARVHAFRSFHAIPSVFGGIDSVFHVYLFAAQVPSATSCCHPSSVPTCTSTLAATLKVALMLCCNACV